MTSQPPPDIEERPVRRPGRRARRAVIISTDGSRPLYKEVKLAITRILSAGEIGGGDAIPTEKQLSERFGVSVGTIRKAIDELVAERVLIRQQGRGTFLATLSPERMLNYFWHIVRKDGTREVPIVQTLSFRKGPADTETAAQLALAPGAGIIHIRNLLLLGGEPVIIDDIRIPQAMFPGLTEADFVARDTTVYGLYQSRFNVSVIKAFDRLGAVPADPVSAKLLGVALSTPLLRADRVALTFEDRPVEYRRSLLLTDRYEYHNALTSEEN